MVYAKFGGQTKCIMGDAKIENDKLFINSLLSAIGKLLWKHNDGVKSGMNLRNLRRHIFENSVRYICRGNCMNVNVFCDLWSLVMF